MARFIKSFPLKKFGSIFLNRSGHDSKQEKVPVDKNENVSSDGKHIERVARVWDAKGLSRDVHRKLNWMDFSIIENCINERISGDPKKNWLIWAKEKYCRETKPAGLVLGCGDGVLERHGIKLGLCDHFDAYDVSGKSIEAARSAAKKEKLDKNINYQICDINNIALKEKSYDLVFCAMSLHHFSRLEQVFEQIEHSLKSGGLFIFNEYVGPSQFQWTDKQLNIINRFLKLLPDKYRKDLSRLGITVKKEVFRPSIEDMDRIDPSEAIRSGEIIPLVKQHFHILEKMDYGGTLLHTLLHNIVGNFDPKKEEDVALLKLLYDIEMLLIDERIIESDFTVVVAADKGKMND